MTAKRFTTNGYYIYDHFKEDKWLVNEVEAEEIVTVMNNLDTKARERSKALSKLQKENEQLNEELCILQIDLCKTKSYEQLEKDNKRLKQAYAQLKHRHSLLHDECIDAECDRDSYRKDIASLEKENEQLKQRINSRLHYYRELYNHFDKNDGFSYNIVERVVEDLEDILR